ncbi:TPA: hypothetical protein G9F26_003955 [Salmonella enterica]|uniref:Zona occludens toxin N-terminal domain-containing protein n=1 Tax=Salmonella enterica TaxID=28901 RepID=A0A750MS12_SALER|nr:hypothetical protein [Salmonella enterica]
MAVKWVTGKLGAGKGLYCNYEMQKYYKEGRRVVTNYPVDTYLLDATSSNPVTVLPSHPRAEDLRALGRGCPDEEKERFGAIFLDEAGIWLNSRTFADKSRLALIYWFIHSRHLGWDVFIIVQNEEMIDKQISLATGEILVICKRSDRNQTILVKLFKRLFLGKNYNASRSSQTKQKGLFRHRVIVETYFQRKSKRDKPFEKFSFFADWYFGIHDTNHIFSDGFEFFHTRSGEVKRVDMRCIYDLLPGKTMADWYHPLQEAIKKPVISKLNLIMVLFFGFCTFLSWRYLLNHDSADSSAAEHAANQALPKNAAAVNTVTVVCSDTGECSEVISSDDAQTLPPSLPLPLPLSDRWRLTGYLNSSAGSPRYVIRDNAGNVRYIASDKPWEGSYSEIEVDGELVTFWTGSNHNSDRRERLGDSSEITPNKVFSVLGVGK